MCDNCQNMWVKRKEVQLEKGKSTLTVRDLEKYSQLYTYLGGNTDTIELNTIQTLDVTDIYGTFHPIEDYTFLWSTYQHSQELLQPIKQACVWASVKDHKLYSDHNMPEVKISLMGRKGGGQSTKHFRVLALNNTRLKKSQKAFSIIGKYNLYKKKCKYSNSKSYRRRTLWHWMQTLEKKNPQSKKSQFHFSPGMMAQLFNPTTGEAKAGTSLKVWSHLGLQQKPRECIQTYSLRQALP